MPTGILGISEKKYYHIFSLMLPAFPDLCSAAKDYEQQNSNGSVLPVTLVKLLPLLGFFGRDSGWQFTCDQQQTGIHCLGK